MKSIVGVDEAGRGPLAGPVVAAAVCLPASYELPGLTDSKRLSAKRRQVLEAEILVQASAYAIAEATVAEIDALNILGATMLAMQRAVAALSIEIDCVLVDGNRTPDLPFACRAIVGGDGIEPAISAASILAKEHRDRLLCALHKDYPMYGFDRHSGYPTKAHREALMEYGPAPCHRTSFAPVKRAAMLHSKD